MSDSKRKKPSMPPRSGERSRPVQNLVSNENRRQPAADRSGRHSPASSYHTLVGGSNFAPDQRLKLGMQDILDDANSRVDDVDDSDTLPLGADALGGISEAAYSVASNRPRTPPEYKQWHEVCRLPNAPGPMIDQRTGLLRPQGYAALRTGKASRRQTERMNEHMHMEMRGDDSNSDCGSEVGSYLCFGHQPRPIPEGMRIFVPQNIGQSSNVSSGGRKWITRRNEFMFTEPGFMQFDKPMVLQLVDAHDPAALVLKQPGTMADSHHELMEFLDRGEAIPIAKLMSNPGMACFVPHDCAVGAVKGLVGPTKMTVPLWQRGVTLDVDSASETARVLMVDHGCVRSAPEVPLYEIRHMMWAAAEKVPLIIIVNLRDILEDIQTIECRTGYRFEQIMHTLKSTFSLDRVRVTLQPLSVCGLTLTYFKFPVFHVKKITFLANGEPDSVPGAEFRTLADIQWRPDFQHRPNDFNPPLERPFSLEEINMQIVQTVDSRKSGNRARKYHNLIKERKQNEPKLWYDDVRGVLGQPGGNAQSDW